MFICFRTLYIIYLIRLNNSQNNVRSIKLRNKRLVLPWPEFELLKYRGKKWPYTASFINSIYSFLTLIFLMLRIYLKSVTFYSEKRHFKGNYVKLGSSKEKDLDLPDNSTHVQFFFFSFWDFWATVRFLCNYFCQWCSTNHTVVSCAIIYFFNPYLSTSHFIYILLVNNHLRM